MLLEKGNSGDIVTNWNVPTEITAPIQKGQKIGEVSFLKDGTEIAKKDLVADCDVEKKSFFDMLKDIIYMIIC